MKAKLQFNLPEEQEEFRIYSNAIKYRSCISDIKNEIRRVIKSSQFKEEQDNFELFLEIVNNILEENGVIDEF